MPSELPRLVTRVPKDTYNKFLKLSEKEDRTISNLLSYIVKKYIDNYETQNGNLITNDDNPSYNQKLANAINKAMEKRNVTSEEMAKDTSVSLRSIESLKNGYLPNFVDAAAVMQHLHFSIDDIIELTNKSEDYVRLLIAQNYALELREIIDLVNKSLNKICDENTETERKIKEIYDLKNYMDSLIATGFYDFELITGKNINQFIIPAYTDDYMDE